MLIGVLRVAASSLLRDAFMDIQAQSMQVRNS